MKNVQGDARNRFDALCQRMGGNCGVDRAFSELEAAYAQPPRAYHNFEHVMACLREFDSARRLCERVDAVEAAIWFHDAIYDPRRSDNEARSAELATRLLTGCGISANLCQTISELILNTRHDHVPASQDGKVIVDVDLSILGQATEVFDAYERAIREEYAYVPNEAFRAGRAAVLDRFLRRDRIYYADHFFDRHESKARENLKHSIRQLRDAAGDSAGETA